MTAPNKIHINENSDTNEYFDDEKYTSIEGDTLFIRADWIWEYLLEKGYEITIKCAGDE